MERFPWYEPPFWEQACEQFEHVERDEGAAVARASVCALLFSRQLLFAIAPFRVPPGAPEHWLWMRPGVDAATVALAASAPLARLGYADLLERNGRILARVLELIDERSEGAPAAAREAVAAIGGRLLERQPVPAVKPGAQAQPWGDRSKELGHETRRSLLDSYLQHPRDQDLSAARPQIDDPTLLELIDAWIADIERNYGELVAAIPADCEDHAELDFVAEAPAGDEAPVAGLPSPAEMRVVADSAVEMVATEAVIVEGGLLSPQPDGIALLPGERWRIRGHRLSDGTVMPCWGTHRVV
jgi:hypothetical protein